MQTYTVFGEDVKACDDACADAYRCDRFARVVYPATRTEGGEFLSAPAASVVENRCIYCGASDADADEPDYVSALDREEF